MKTVKSVAPRYLEKAAIEEFAAKLREQGYEVEIEASLGSYRTDLIARQDGKITVYEFKSGPWPEDKAKRVRELRNHVVHEKGGKFELVLVNPYREVPLHVEGLEHLLVEAIRENPGPLDSLSTHTLVDEVDDIQISSLDIGPGEVSLAGDGIVYVELNYGSRSDRSHDFGTNMFNSFPFTFTARLNKELHPVEKPKILVDTSSFYE